MAYRKANRWYADWRDENGKRRRKAFTVKRDAEQHQTKQSERATALRTLKAEGLLPAALTVSTKPTKRKPAAKATTPRARARKVSA
jgi:hypothetical protein